jgi:hypothetical protein
MRAQAMIARPASGVEPPPGLVHCIEACFDCMQACIACADACLSEDSVADLRQCIRLDLDCADICAAAGALASRGLGPNEAVFRLLLEGCAEACRVCGDECERHAVNHAHCRICADACRICERACRSVATILSPSAH